MKSWLIALFIVAVQIVYPSLALAQAFGEYGRSVGSIPHGKGVAGPGPFRGGSQGNVSGGGTGELGVGRTLPVRLVVAAKDVALFPRQDDQSEKISQLAEGENLTPLVQSEGGSQWYMVRTQTGLVGWVKSADVKQEKTKK
jgi:hypothetical protein